MKDGSLIFNKIELQDCYGRIIFINTFFIKIGSVYKNGITLYSNKLLQSVYDDDHAISYMKNCLQRIK